MAEALAALTVGAATLVALASLVALFSQNAGGVAARFEEIEARERCLQSLAKDISRAARARWTGNIPRPFVFVGAPDRLLFAIDDIGGGGPEHPIVIEIQAVSNLRGGLILRATASLGPASTGIDTLRFAPPHVLYRGPWSVRFAYVTAATRTEPEILTDVWSDPAAMPSAVRISLVNAQSGHAVSQLRVKLRHEGEIGCLSPAKGFCSRKVDQVPPDEDGSSIAAILGNLHLERR
ncbi:prepilin-type cleavage/methylation domain-containing protein [Methylobacterium nigriterrae]|uniref:prepilin-type cleavage/methylation domain-containing protein n=1 Tax=Methylobacterium nigriterrae TaxID=3127512 RepID=UPI003013267F